MKEANHSKALGLALLPVGAAFFAFPLLVSAQIKPAPKATAPAAVAVASVVKIEINPLPAKVKHRITFTAQLNNDNANAVHIAIDGNQWVVQMSKIGAGRWQISKVIEQAGANRRVEVTPSLNNRSGSPMIANFSVVAEPTYSVAVPVFKIGQVAAFSVAVTNGNLLATAVMSLQDGESQGASGGKFSFIPRIAGAKNWELKDKPNGTVLAKGSVTVQGSAKVAPIGVSPGVNSFDKYGLVVPKHYHTGIDYVASVGTPVVAVVDGVVTAVPAGAGGTIDNHCMGNIIFLKTSTGKYYLYAHLDSIAVKTGQAVTAGTKLGGVGSTGFNAAARASCRSSAPAHLHFELKDSQVLHNPGGSGQHWGYTPGSATSYGYSNPAQ